MVTDLVSKIDTHLAELRKDVRKLTTAKKLLTGTGTKHGHAQRKKARVVVDGTTKTTTKIRGRKAGK